MQSGVLLALALLAANAGRAPLLSLELRVFNGADEVTAQTRAAVHRAGQRTDPLVVLASGTPLLAADVPAGIYDVQAIREREGRVVSIRWAERLVVMPYPDENGHHLEVVNFQTGFGALQVRAADGRRPEIGVYRVGDHQKPVAAPAVGPDYVLFVLPAGLYDLQVREQDTTVWQTAVEVPLDRTRLWVTPAARRSGRPGMP